jgi:hypothetical protein
MVAQPVNHKLRTACRAHPPTGSVHGFVLREHADSQGVLVGIDLALWLVGRLHGHDRARVVHPYIQQSRCRQSRRLGMEWLTGGDASSLTGSSTAHPVGSADRALPTP